MKNKKLMTIVFIFILIVLDVFCISLNVRKSSNLNQSNDVDDVVRNNSKLEEIEENTDDDKTGEKVDIGEKTNEETPKKDDTTATGESKKQSTPTYNCPDGYTLNGTTCTKTVLANYACPKGMTDAGGGCVNLSNGKVINDGESCGDGYTMIDQNQSGGPTIHYCYLVQSKVYTCNEGYSLNGSNCVKHINATRN